MAHLTNPFASTLHLNGNTNSNKNGTHIKLNGGGVSNSNKYAEERSVPSPDLRVHGVTIFRPIVYGNVSNRLDRPPPKNETISSRSLQEDNQDWFRWTVYVRGIANEDLSYFIKKVVFYLHESYTEPIRVIEQAPFELTEEGWGQFDIKIEIYFHDNPAERKPIAKSVPLPNGHAIHQHENGHSKQQNDKASNSNHDQDFECKADSDLHPIFAAKRSFDDMLHQTRCGNTGAVLNCDEVRADALKSLIHRKEDELLEIIPSCYDTSNENKVWMIHSLRLFPQKDGAEDHMQGIIEEKYSEIQFIDPYYYLYEKLVMGPHKLFSQHPFIDHWKHSAMEQAEKEQMLIEKMSNAHKQLLKKIEAANAEYQELVNKQNKLKR